ncbi:SDR family oxidoreductase [Bradyrhizobium sp.]|uniref:SDR family oxidoreductase n=1 Tax=Bradyrhizobium sp. TaxID=376 RepID=UPI002D3CF764|nr:SDR family oxidoreductase [Bradyrhizobium sp.]HZR72640.1 SDR family oxidoreductase [Bradyrhizobium sp.]
MKSLTGKVAIVTGASSGIGRAVARLFAEEGAQVVVGARRAAELDRLVAEIEVSGGKAAALAGDVRDEAYARALVGLAETTFGGLDIAFNNAGTLGEMGPTTEVSVAAFTEAIATNLTAAFLGAKYQLPAMLRRGAGSLIFTSSIAGHTVGFPGVASYSASKSGLIGLTQSLAAEFGPKHIRVNAILPGAVDTPLYRQMNATAEAQSFIAGLHALKRVASPEEIARAVLYLASDDASFMTGAALIVDGGTSINRT